MSISLLALFANHKFARSGPQPVTAAAVETGQSPFAYVREDGSELVVPAAGQGPLFPAPPPEAPDPGSSLAAVYTWSSPVMAPAISASPSWQ